MRRKRETRPSAQAGYTLIEMMTVMGLVGLFAVAAIISLSSMRSGILRRETHAQILSAYEQARSRAATGVDGSAHGVHVEADEIVLFSGAAYVPGDGDVYSVPGGISVGATEETVIFTKLSGAPDVETVVTVSASSGTPSTITVSGDGAINSDE